MYSWIAETFGIADGLARGLAFAIALGIVLILIALFVFILKRLTGTRLSAGRSRQPRIAVMDATSIDTRRRLLLIRRDNVEHLILVGGPTDIVVEQNIIKGAPIGAGASRNHGTMPNYAAPAPEASPEAPAVSAAPQTGKAFPPVSGHSITPPPANGPDTSASLQGRPPQAPVPRDAQAPTAPAPAPARSPQQAAASSLNPAKSLLQAAAAGKISSGFSKTATAAEPAPRQPAENIPVQARRPEPAAQQHAATAPAVQVHSGTPPTAMPSAGARQPAAAPSIGTRAPGTAQPSLSASLAAARPNALSSRQVSPPSSGPAARARSIMTPSYQAAERPATATATPTTSPAVSQDASAEVVEAPKPSAEPELASAPPAAENKAPEIILEAPATSNGSAGPEEEAASSVADSAQTDDQKKNDSSAPQEMPNPIEDEMAKLLDEITGPQKQ